VTRIVSEVLRWVMRQAAILLLILAVLLGMAWLNGELKRTADLQRERDASLERKHVFATRIAALERGASENVRRAEALKPLQALLERKRAERQALWDSHVLSRHIPMSEAWRSLKLLDAEIRSYEAVAGPIAQKVELTMKDLAARKAAAERELADAEAEIARTSGELGKSSVARVATAVRRDLPIALSILLALILAPIGIKLFLYYVVAPLAQRRPPTRLFPESPGHPGAPGATGRVSAVSVPVLLEEGEELLVQPEYLQSSPVAAKKKTKWLLDAAIPLSSLLSGMFMLTRVEAAGAEPVVVSATKSPLDEVGLVRLEEGAAFVCQPRALAGVIQQRERPIRITRHWRFGLQNWLTLQLRFLVFHGPGQLVMKGCRGVRVEEPGAGRMINQAATLGFSANLAYANTRCETFVSYWSGKEELFNDAFSGGPGVYVYEEMPAAGEGASVGRWLKGFTDALLKVFGI
jgi:hypothetical protein